MNYKSIKIIMLLFLMVASTGCDLPLQENFDFKPDVDTTDPFAGMTAWDWIQTKSIVLPDGKYDGDEFNYLIAAIKKAGFEAEYNQVATTNRTYLLLNNNAFTGGGDVISIVTGSATVPAGETAEQTMARVDTPEKLEKLKTVLRYHIVTTYIAQVPTLTVAGTWYLFQTLIPGEDGLIAFSRDPLWRITINRSPAPLPAAALNQWERVLSHNYVFKNGIGHIIADPVRNKPY